MRLPFFLFGLLLGCFLVFFFLKKKDVALNYFPNERVLSQIKRKKITYAATIKSTDTLLCQKILRQGSVIFSESNVNKYNKCNNYKVSLEKENVSIRIDLCDSIAFVTELKNNQQNKKLIQ